MRSSKLRAAIILVIIAAFMTGFAYTSNTISIDDAINKALAGSATLQNQKLSLSTVDVENNLDKQNDAYNQTILYGYHDTTFDVYEMLDSFQSHVLSPFNITLRNVTAQNSIKITENSVKLSTYSAYEAVLKANNALKLQSLLVKTNTDQLNTSKAKYSKGLIAKATLDTLSAQNQIQIIKLKQYQRSYDLAVKQLNNLMRVPLDQKYDSFASNSVFDSYDLKPVDYYIDQAFKNRNELVLDNSNYQIQLIKYNFVNDKYEYNPNIKDSVGEDTSKLDASNYANMSAKYALDSVKSTYTTDKINIELEIRNQYKTIQNQISSYQNAKASYDKQKSDMLDSDKKHSLGLISDLDYNSQKSSLSQSEISLDNSKYDICLNILKLNYASDLGPGLSTNTNASMQY